MERSLRCHLAACNLENAVMCTRYEILKIEEQRKEQGASDLIDELDSSLEDIQEDYLGLENYSAIENQTYARQIDINHCMKVATLQHLELGLDPAETEEYIEEGAAIAVDYFYGDYWKNDRDTAYMMKKSARNKDLSWFEVYRTGLLLAFLSQDAEAELKLIDYVESWLPFDESSYLVTAQDNDYHKLLAEFIEHDEFLTRKLESSIKKCRKQRPRLLLACLIALRDCDVDVFVNNLKKFLNYYYKSEFGEGGIDSYFSIEASILWFLAEWLDLVPTGLTKKQAALIMTRETLCLTP
jgi:hypothetical protein